MSIEGDGDKMDLKNEGSTFQIDGIIYENHPSYHTFQKLLFS